MATTKELAKQLAATNRRLSELVDQIHILKNELRTFKSRVAEDVNTLSNKIDK